MSEEQQLKLQAFLDGELPESDAREVAGLVRRDASAAALLAELKNTRTSLAGVESAASVPETREFYWSKIEREIQKLAPAKTHCAGPIVNWRRLLWPIGTAVVCFAVVMMEAWQMDKPETNAEAMADADAPIVEPAQADSAAITYQDKTENTTLVWFSTSDDGSTTTQDPEAAF